MTAKAYINKQKGTCFKTLHKEVTQLIHLQFLKTVHVAGWDNTLADWLSWQRVDQSESMLCKEVFHPEVWNCRSESLHYRAELPSEKVCVKNKKPRRAELQLATNSSHTENVAVTDRSKGGADTRRPLLAKEGMDSGSEEVVNNGSMVSATEERSIITRGSRSFSPRLAKTHSLEIERQQVMDLGYLQGVVQTMLDSRTW